MTDAAKSKQAADNAKPAKAEKVQRAEQPFHLAFAGSGKLVWRSEDGEIIKPVDKDAA